MTDELNPFAEFGATEGREYAAALVRNGTMDVATANKHLSERGSQPLNERSGDIALAEKERLKHDQNFIARFCSGDVEATKRMNDLDARIVAGKGGLMDSSPSPADYKLGTESRFPDSKAEDVAKFNGTFTSLFAGLEISPADGRALVDMHHQAAANERNMSEENYAVWQNQQTELLMRALGPTFQDQVKAANAVLRGVTGNPNLDVEKIARTNGAEFTWNVIARAQHYMANRGKAA